MDQSYKNRFEADWNSDYKQRFKEMLPDIRLKRKKGLIGFIIFIVICALVVGATLENPPILLISVLLLIPAVVWYRKIKISPDYEVNAISFKNSLKDRVFTNSLMSWNDGGLSGMHNLSEEFKTLFSGDSFHDVSNTNLHYATPNGSKTVLSQLEAKQKQMVRVSKTRHVNGKVEHYTETEERIVTVFDGWICQVKFDVPSDLIAKGHFSRSKTKIALNLLPKGLEPVDLESTDFESKIDLYANNQRQVRELFTPDLINEINDWLSSYQGDLFFHIEEQSIVFATTQKVNMWPAVSEDESEQKQRIENVYHFIAHIDTLISRLIYHQRHRVNNFFE